MRQILMLGVTIGVVAFHVSNAYLNLAPEIALVAEAEGMQARVVESLRDTGGGCVPGDLGVGECGRELLREAGGGHANCEPAGIAGVDG